jgi:uncharacterized phage-associated protein
MQREDGKTPNGNDISGRWVLRDDKFNWVDFVQMLIYLENCAYNLYIKSHTILIAILERQPRKLFRLSRRYVSGMFFAQTPDGGFFKGWIKKVLTSRMGRVNTMATIVSIRDIADFVICYCNNQGIPITPLKLQKVLYYIQAWHLVFFDGNPLFNEEPEAWVNGPVYRSMYNVYKKKWLEEKTLTICFSGECGDKLEELRRKMNLSKDQEEYLFAVLQKYITMPTSQLVLLTHIEPPWNIAREGYRPLDRCDNKITHAMMNKYYSSKRRPISE